jgi:hypothetical protein
MMPIPVRVPRDTYRGREPRRLRKRDEYNRVAQRVEAYLNDDLAKQAEHTVTVYFSHTIANALQEDSDLVQRVVFGIDAGSGGVTICKGDFDEAMRRRSQLPEK